MKVQTEMHQLVFKVSWYFCFYFFCFCPTHWNRLTWPPCKQLHLKIQVVTLITSERVGSLHARLSSRSKGKWPKLPFHMNSSIYCYDAGLNENIIPQLCMLPKDKQPQIRETFLFLKQVFSPHRFHLFKISVPPPKKHPLTLHKHSLYSTVPGNPSPM